MSHKQIVLLHSRQPLGAGARSILTGESALKPILLTNGQGLPFRDTNEAPNIDLVVKDKSSWLQHIAACGDDVEVITNDEFCLEDCRRIRAAMGKKDTWPGKIANYRDKWAMQQALRAMGIATARSIAIPKGELDAGTFARATTEIGGHRFILKPVDEANLRGIVMADTRKPAAEQMLLSQPSAVDYLIEEFLDGPQYHVDCIVADGEVTTVLVGQYISPLLDLASGRPSGSVSIERADPQWEKLSALATEAIRCLGSDGRFVAHVELLSDPGGLRIGEVACRAPGGDVPWQSLSVANIDLEVANLSLQLGKAAPHPVDGMPAAWVWIPGAYRPPLINKTYGAFVNRFLGTGWLSPAKSSGELWQRVDKLLQQIPSTQS